MERINVTQSFLPPRDEYLAYLNRIFKGRILTNQGPLVLELEAKLKNFLQTRHLQYVTNGTVALQLALRALEITGGEVITTPFSYVATVSAIMWEGCTPVFADIEPDNFTLAPQQIEEAITPETRAIMPVHVFGYACDTDAIGEIAQKRGLKVIYDAAHAFAVGYKGRSLLDYGDVSTCSFHATKLFHTIEGGACIAQDSEIDRKLDLLKKFGHINEKHFQLGINAKQSEFHAAMGLANLDYLSAIVEERKNISEMYDVLLPQSLQRPAPQPELEYNYAYYPVAFGSEEELLKTIEALRAENVHPRRYFHPALNKLPYVMAGRCPVAEDIAARIACLPLFVGLNEDQVHKICRCIRRIVGA
jgi:dTDP-4-amino-4,6-dideoxygalactose transaminase